MLYIKILGGLLGIFLLYYVIMSFINNNPDKVVEEESEENDDKENDDKENDDKENDDKEN
jgi:hypothetical protein